MRFGVIGLGKIAQKAYLPVYSECREAGEFILATRKQATRELIQSKYGFDQVVATIDELIAAGIEACFVHVATVAHYTVVERLLQSGIHVFIDKPLSERLTEVQQLQTLAAEKELLLMVGFNRRFAPFVDTLKKIENKNLIFLQKNRVQTEQNTDFMIYDLFLHLVDTAVYLLDAPIQQMQSKLIEKEGQLQRALLHLETEKTTAICSMDLFAGANTEHYQVTALSGTYLLENLTELTVQTATATTKQGFDDWKTTLHKRGFAPMVKSFIASVHSQQTDALKQDHIFLSHELCHKMLLTHQKHIL